MHWEQRQHQQQDRESNQFARKKKTQKALPLFVSPTTALMSVSINKTQI